MTRRRNGKVGRYLTVSVDDGHPDDRRVAELLDRYDLAGTFYIPARNPERAVMSTKAIRDLAQLFEIGAHTFNHRPLRGLPASEVRSEVENGKDWLQQAIGRPIESFCYPKGQFDRGALSAAADAGFLGSRTCMYNVIDYPKHPQCWGLSTHAYSHSAAIQIRHAILGRNWKGLWNYLKRFRDSVDWVSHFKCVVDLVEECGGVAHLYLHGWEISATNQWDRLESLFRYLSRSTSFDRLTNGQLFAQWHRTKGS